MVRAKRIICIARTRTKEYDTNETSGIHLCIRSDASNHLAILLVILLAIGSDGSKGNIPPSTIRVDGLAIKLSGSTSGTTMAKAIILFEQSKHALASHLILCCHIEWKW